MFEGTLEAQALHQGTGKFGTLSAAALAHLALGLAIVAVTAIIVPPVRGPEPPPRPISIVRGIESIAPERPLAPRKKTEAPTSRTAIPPKPPDPQVPPKRTPETLSMPTSPSAGPPGETTGPPIGTDLDGPGGPGGPGVDDTGSGTDVDAAPVEVTADMSRPVLLVKVEPAYPEVPRKARLGGRVVVRAVIGPDGTIESAGVFASTNRLFDDAAVNAVRQWRYRPALMNGTPVRVYFSVVVDFVLR